MKAILMAAGVGSRLKGQVKGPKCLLDVNGEPLVMHTIRMLQKYDVEIGIVIGYEKNTMIEALKDTGVHFFYNPFYKVTNSMGSLWMARDFIPKDENVILGNADVYWGEDILQMLFSDEREAVMLSDRTRVDVGDYFFGTENGRIISYGKELTREERDCEYVGLAKLSKSFVGGFKKRVDECVERELYDLWWENVLYNYSRQFPVYALDVDGRFWGEVDYIDDYKRIVDHVTAKSGN